MQEEEAVKGLTNRMKAMLSPFVLRRLKSQVASQLTAKQQHEEVVSMTPEQAALYQKAVQRLRADVAVVGAQGVTATAKSAPLCICHHACTLPVAYCHIAVTADVKARHCLALDFGRDLCVLVL